MELYPPNKPTQNPRIAEGLSCILVVEDHGEMSAALKTFFDILGHRARFAVNVASALRVASEEAFDVLLTDIGLPDGNGWDLRRQLVEAGRCPPRSIAMSGFGLREHVTRSEAAGFAHHLVKPFDPERLIAALSPVAAADAFRTIPVASKGWKPGKRPMHVPASVV